MTTDQPTQPLDIDAIRARAEAATPGPWFTDGKWFHPWEVCIDANRPLIEMEDTTRGIADAAFIASVRKDVPALLAEVERLRAVTDAAIAWRKAVKAAVADDIPEPDAWTVFEGRALIAAIDKLTALPRPAYALAETGPAPHDQPSKDAPRRRDDRRPVHHR